MRRNDYDEYDDERDSYSSRGDFGKTSNFTTSLIGKDDRFFGVQLDHEMADKARSLFPVILTYLTDQGERLGTKYFKSVKVGNAIGYSIALSQQGFEIGQNVVDSLRSLNDLRVAVRPLDRVGNNNSTAPLSGNNEVVSNARTKIRGVFWQKLSQTAAGAVAAAPALYHHISKQRGKNNERQLLDDIAKAKGDPDKLAKILEKELTVGGMNIGLDSMEIQVATEKMIETRRAAYVKKFEEFKKANKSGTESELKKTLKDLKADNIKYDIPALNRQGFDTEELRASLNDRYDRKNETSVPADKEKALKEFRAASTKRIDSLADRALRAKFVRQHGAFDEEWLEHLGDRNHRDHDTPQTIKQQLEEQIEKLRDADNKAKEADLAAGKGQDGTFSEVIEGGKGLAAGIAASFTRKLFGGKAIEQYEKPIALDLILHLRRTLEQTQKDAPELVASYPNSGDTDMGYAQYVHMVFQQHQKDCNRTEIGERFFEHFEKAGWDDAAIQKLPDDELSTYEYAVKTIAKRVKDGRMDSIALIELAGDKHKKIVGNDGRTFGPQGASQDDTKAKKAIEKIINEKTLLLHPGKEQTDAEINEKLGNFVFNVADMRRALESKELEQYQRAFIFTLFSDVVGSDEKLCGRIGVSTERCQALRKECTESFNAMFDSAVSVLADIIENEPKHADAADKEKNPILSDKQKNLILSLAQRSKEDGKGVADATENREERLAVETAVANAIMSDVKNGTQQNFWQRLVSAIKNKEQPKKREIEAAEDSHDMSAHSPADTWAEDEGEHKSFAERLPSPDALATLRERNRKAASAETPNSLGV